MTNFNVSRMPKGGSFSARLALASGPLFALLACSVYDEPLGAAGGAGAGGGAPGNVAGATSGGASNTAAGSAGSDGGGTTAGSGATSGTFAGGGAGSAGSDVGGTSSGGSETAGTDAGGQPADDASIVDDMEDTDAQITVTAGRNGYWYVGNDLTAGGVQEPPSSKFEMFELTAGENGDSTYSAHMKVSGWTGWGTVIGFNLVESAGVKPYDASAYCGLSFSGKAAAGTSLRFRLPDGDTHPAGGVCVETGAADQLCHDHFSAPVTLTTAWKTVSILFSQLEQLGTGYHPADKKLKAHQLYAVEWALPGSAGKAYEIWIDDVSLLTCP
jgi:hypothetical protein